MSDKHLVGKTQLIEVVAEAAELPRSVVARALDAMADLAAANLAAGSRVKLPGIGILEPVRRDPRFGIGPGGKPYFTLAQRTVRLRPAKALRDHLNGETTA